MMTLALCQHALGELAGLGKGKPFGSARIHGGGFGGTIQVIVPNERVEAFTNRVNGMLGEDSCMLVHLGAPGIKVERSAA